MFIVIEGIDGSGKGTQVKLIRKYLKEIGKKVKVVDYPRYGKKGAIFVEKYLNGKYGKKVNAKTASLFYALDRFDSSKNLKSDLKKFDFVIANRYATSNMIHQAGKLSSHEEIDSFLDWLDEIEFQILGIPKPDLVIFLDVNPEVSQKLILKKKKRKYIESAENKDIHEKDKNHLINAYNTAKYVAEKYNWKIINCTKSGEILDKESITEMIIKEILI